ncbi:MAG TPA: hypothetical protein VLT86_20145 [Vicinamibacterales bacterium]|nr:hypothetical protein [Vicinamibacterales bacterium]
MQLSSDPARGFSPDGAWALVQHRGATHPTLLPTAAGTPLELSVGPGLEASPADAFARWSRDGHRLFLPLRRAGGGPDSARIYVSENHGPWRAVTPEGIANEFVVSPDGEWIATNDPTDDRRKAVVTLYAVDGRPARRLEGELGQPVRWSNDGRYLYLLTPGFPGVVYRRDLTTGRIEPWRTLAPADPTGVQTILSVLIADDERSYVYLYNRGVNDLFLARDLR